MDATFLIHDPFFGDPNLDKAQLAGRMFVPGGAAPMACTTARKSKD
jgi:hypothetical protein